MVQCYHCGISLRDWNPEERPWEEHAKWSPDCAYLLLKKGGNFVEEVQKKWRNRNMEEAEVVCVETITINFCDGKKMKLH